MSWFFKFLRSIFSGEEDDNKHHGPHAIPLRDEAKEVPRYRQALLTSRPQLVAYSATSPRTPLPEKASAPPPWRAGNDAESNKKCVLPLYEIPKHLKELIERNKVPPVLLGALSPESYVDYFACLLYAEDYYAEKWSEFLLSGVTLELLSRAPYENARESMKMDKNVRWNEKDFVAFEIDSVPERLPFLLSRDFVFVRPSDKTKLLRNRMCDVLMRSLQKDIPRSMLFRANAAFRDYDLVPDDIIPACLYEGECFTYPPLSELRNFKVVTSTFMSSYRLHNAGISADHFTHIFLADASSVIEPEAIVALADLVSKKTVIVVTGSSKDFPHLVRSDIGQMHGLGKSYFNRLLEREPYLRRDAKFITHL